MPHRYVKYKEDHLVKRVVPVKEIHETVVRRTGLHPAFVHKALSTLYEVINEELSKSNAVFIEHLGRFTLRERKGRFIPPSKEFPEGYQQPYSTIVRFKMSRAMNRAVNLQRPVKTKRASVHGKPVNQAPEGYSTSKENWRPEIPLPSTSRASSRSPQRVENTGSPTPCPSSGSPSCIGESPGCKSGIGNNGKSGETIGDEIDRLFPEPKFGASPKP